MIDFNFERNETPWKWFANKYCLNKKLVQSLYTGFEHEQLSTSMRLSGSDKTYVSSQMVIYFQGKERCFNQFNFQNLNTESFLNYLKSNEYRSQLSEFIDIDLSDCKLEITLNSYKQGSFMSYHTDSEDKVATQLFYLNTAPENSGGELLISRDGKITDAIISPQAGSSIVLVRSDSSWHAVNKVRNPNYYRKTIQVSFWKKERTQKKGRVYMGKKKNPDWWRLTEVKKECISKVVEVQTDGFKHASVLLISAAISSNTKCKIKNIPDLLDIDVMKFALEGLNGVFQWDKLKKEILLDSSSIEPKTLNSEVLKSVHGTIYLIPALLCRFKKVQIFETGGCPLGKSGTRPFEHVLNVMQKFGAKLDLNTRNLTIGRDNPQDIVIDCMDYSISDKKLSGPYISGATKAALIMAAGLNVNLKIEGFYKKRDVLDLVEFLESIGHLIKLEKNTLILSKREYVDKILDFSVSSDSIEVVTLICLSGLLNKITEIKVNNLFKTMCDIRQELEWLQNAGFKFERKDGGILKVFPPTRVSAGDLYTDWDKMYSDSVPLLAILGFTRGQSIFTIKDKVWSNRFQYLEEIEKLLPSRIDVGDIAQLKADIYSNLENNVDLLEGKDLRSVAALILFGIATGIKGPVFGISHLNRGYVNLFDKLQLFGVEGETDV